MNSAPRARTPLRILTPVLGRRGGGAQYALGLARTLARRGDVAEVLSLSRQTEMSERTLR